MSHQGDARHTAGSSDAHDRIRRRAYELYLSRGGHHGGDFDDWLAAERELADRGEPSALTEPSTLTERVDADAGVLGASSDAEVTSGAAAAAKPNGKPAPARKAAAKGTATKAPATKTAATKAAAPAKPAAAKPAAKSAAKAAPEASAPAAPKKPAARKKGTSGPSTSGNGGAD